MPEFPLCARCGYRHAIPRFADLRTDAQPPCDREPRTLQQALAELLDAEEAGRETKPAL